MLQFDDLTLERGEFRLSANWTLPATGTCAVIGPSGAGKSTLLDLIAGFAAPTRGRITWNDADITPLAPDKRPVAMLFQDNNLFPHLTVTENLALALRPRGGQLDKTDRNRIEDALQNVGLASLGSRRPGQLSGGQQSRAALARLWLQKKPILALDEPFAALGPALKTDMLDLVLRLSHDMNGLTLLVTHDPEDAKRFADVTVLVADGVAAPPKPTDALFDDPPEALRKYLGT